MEETKEERHHNGKRNEHSEDRDILQIVNSIEGCRRKAEESLPDGGEEVCAIYQVSKALRQVNEKCYEPQLVSIGPYHRDKERLKPMEEKKSLYLLALLSRNPELKLEDFVKEIKELEAKARKCYSGSISLKSKEFVEMMVFDGCFLVETFLRIRITKINDELWLPLFISHDMLLLENQLPFFILERIFSHVEPNKEAGFMKELFLYCFNFIYIMPLNMDTPMKESYHHVLDMFHHHCLPKPSESSSDPVLHQIQTLIIKAQSDPDPNAALLQEATDIEAQSHQDKVIASKLSSWRAYWPFSIRSAEELQEAGIKFERKEAKTPGSFLDLEFDKKGVLKIPFLYFSDNLQTIFQNLIAFEQCYPKAGTFFTGYAFFMDNLINTAKDVQILRHARILEHGLGSDDELAQNFNELCRRICYQALTTHLFIERVAINVYCGKSWPTWRAKLMRNYFSSPWAILSLIAAVLLLLLTITQTVFSILPYV